MEDKSCKNCMFCKLIKGSYAICQVKKGGLVQISAKLNNCNKYIKVRTENEIIKK